MTALWSRPYDWGVPYALLIGAYLVGAIPFGLLLARVVAGVDVREAGSGNIGATNVARSAGKGLGVVTLALDALKGAAPVLVARALAQPEAVVALAGLLAVVGHIFPVYLKFRGGKGVATALGLFAVLAPWPTLAAVLVFALVFAISRTVSLGSLIAALALLGAMVWLQSPREVLLAAIFLVALVFWRHRGNIQRLVRRSELKV